MENNTINILVIFGATGDLANRKIYPALNEISKSDKLPENFKIIGCGRKELKENIFSKLQSNLASNCDYIKLDPMIEDDYKLLSKKLNDYKNISITLNVIFYLSTPPRAYKPIIDNLINNKLNIEESGYRRIIIEKPFGKIYIEYGEPVIYDKTMDQADCIKNFIRVMETTEKNNLQYTNNDKS